VTRKPDPLMVALREARIQCGLSQAALGGLIESDGGQVSHWELGNRDLRLSSVRRMLDALGLDVLIVDKRPVR